MPELSIAIPMYNAARYITAVLASIHENHFTDYEILLIDDGSTDETAKICEDLQARYHDVRLIRKRHGGVASARNAGMDEAGGKYIAFIDADDMVTKDYLNALVSTAEAKQVDWVACGYRELWPDGHVHGRGKDRPIFPVFRREVCFYGQEAREAVKRAVFYGPGKNNLASACMGVYRIGLLREHGIRFREDIAYGEDTLFNYEVASKLNGFAYLPPAMYLYLQHSASSKHTMFQASIMESEMTLMTALDEKRQALGDAWSYEALRYLMLQIFTIFRQHILLLEDNEERQRAYETVDQALGREPIAGIWEKITAKHAIGIWEKGFLQLLKKRSYRLMDLCWRSFAKRMVLGKNAKNRQNNHESGAGNKAKQ